jgi:hypothetical protein
VLRSRFAVDLNWRATEQHWPDELPALAGSPAEFAAAESIRPDLANDAELARG